MALWTASDVDHPADTSVPTSGTTTGSAVITKTDTTGLVIGDLVSGTGIPTGSTIKSIITNTSYTISAPCTATGTVTVTAKHKAAGKPKSLTVEEQLVTVGFDEAETAKTPVTHAGWVKVTTGSGGRAGRKQYETLIASSSVAGVAADDTEAPEPTITTFAMPANLTAQARDAIIASACTVTPGAGIKGTITYQWQVSANGSTGWADIAGQTTTTLGQTLAAVAVTTYYYRLQAKIGTKVIGTSANWTATTV